MLILRIPTDPQARIQANPLHHEVVARMAQNAWGDGVENYEHAAWCVNPVEFVLLLVISPSVYAFRSL